MAEEGNKKFEGHNMQLDPKKIMEAMTQAMACMYNTQKGPSQKLSGMKPTGGKPYQGKCKLAEITKGLDGMTNHSLMCHYCKGNRHELDNCRKLPVKNTKRTASSRKCNSRGSFK